MTRHHVNLEDPGAYKPECTICRDLSTAGIVSGSNFLTRKELAEYENAARGGCKSCQFLIEVVSPYEGPGGMELWITPGSMLDIFVKAKDQMHRYNVFIPKGMSIFCLPRESPSHFLLTI